MNNDLVIEKLNQEPKLYSEIHEFSKEPGIYALFYQGSKSEKVSLPFDIGTLLYVGKTETSQQSRDANTHFKTGKTGSSTVRKSIGAILLSELELKPIPRNDSDFKKNRKSHFKFDEKSEERLTKWMRDNIAMTYYEFLDGLEELDKTETDVVEMLIPPLNIDYKNPNNPYSKDIKKLRKNCALTAHQQQKKSFVPVEERSNTKTKKRSETIDSNSKTGKYSDFWTKQLPTIKKVMKDSSLTSSIKLLQTDFQRIGNRNSYSFNIQFEDGEVKNNIGGSAVARDLARVMKNDSEMRKLLKQNDYKFRLDSSFSFWLERG